MSKIRINELARQLEVPSHEILDMLPELGITEKKTHSSSIDESTAELVLQRLSGNGSALAAEHAAEPVAAPPQPEAPVALTPAPKAAEEPAAVPGATLSPAAPQPVAPPVQTSEEPGIPAAVAEEARSKPAPLRPPLSTGTSAPIHPPRAAAATVQV